MGPEGRDNREKLGYLDYYILAPYIPFTKMTLLLVCLVHQALLPYTFRHQLTCLSVQGADPASIMKPLEPQVTRPYRSLFLLRCLTSGIMSQKEDNDFKPCTVLSPAHSSILAWRIPRTEEPGGLYSIRSQRVRHD